MIILICNFAFVKKFIGYVNRAYFMTYLIDTAVIVAPSGMLGRLVGCCPNDLARQVYSRYLKTQINMLAPV